MSSIRLSLLAPLTLTACQQAATDNRTSPPAADNTYLTRIAALPPAQQQMVLFRAIRDAHQDCQDIDRTERLPDQDGRALWRVTCRGGGQLAVSIGADGIANVTAPRR